MKIFIKFFLVLTLALLSLPTQVEAQVKCETCNENGNLKKGDPKVVAWMRAARCSGINVPNINVWNQSAYEQLVIITGSTCIPKCISNKRAKQKTKKIVKNTNNDDGEIDYTADTVEGHRRGNKKPPLIGEETPPFVGGETLPTVNCDSLTILKQENAFLKERVDFLVPRNVGLKRLTDSLRRELVNCPKVDTAVSKKLVPAPAPVFTKNDTTVLKLWDATLLAGRTHMVSPNATEEGSGNFFNASLHRRLGDSSKSWLGVELQRFYDQYGFDRRSTAPPRSLFPNHALMISYRTEVLGFKTQVSAGAMNASRFSEIYPVFKSSIQKDINEDYSFYGNSLLWGMPKKDHSFDLETGLMVGGDIKKDKANLKGLIGVSTSNVVAEKLGVGEEKEKTSNSFIVGVNLGLGEQQEQGEYPFLAFFKGSFDLGGVKKGFNPHILEAGFKVGFGFGEEVIKPKMDFGPPQIGGTDSIKTFPTDSTFQTSVGGSQSYQVEIEPGPVSTPLPLTKAKEVIPAPVDVVDSRSEELKEKEREEEIVKAIEAHKRDSIAQAGKILKDYEASPPGGSVSGGMGSKKDFTSVSPEDVGIRECIRGLDIYVLDSTSIEGNKHTMILGSPVGIPKFMNLNPADKISKPRREGVIEIVERNAFFKEGESKNIRYRVRVYNGNKAICKTIVEGVFLSKEEYKKTGRENRK